MKLKQASIYLSILSIALLLLITLPTSTNHTKRYLNEILIPQDGLILRALFSPKDDIRRTIIELINYEQEAIKLAAYFFTDTSIAHALMLAQQRGIKIEVIIEPKHLESCEHTKIFELYQTKIEIFVFKHSNKYGIFHHKFIWFKKNLNQANLLLTGSFNFTNTAQTQNQENVIITNYLNITNSYLKQFDFLKNQHTIKLSKFIKQHKLKLA